MKPRAGSDDILNIRFNDGNRDRYGNLLETIFQGPVKDLEAILRYWGYDVPRKRP